MSKKAKKVKIKEKVKSTDMRFPALEFEVDCTEPHLAERPDLVWYEGFEDELWRERWTFTRDTATGKLLAHDKGGNTGGSWGIGAENCRLAREQENVFDGDSSLEITYQKDGHWGTSCNLILDESHEQLFLRYYIRYERRFDFGAGGNKLSGLRGVVDPGNPAGHGGRPADGYNAFACLPVTDRFGNLNLQVYHVNSSTKYGSLFRSSASLKLGEWQCIELMLRCNTWKWDAKLDDGIIKLWVDNELCAEETGLLFRKSNNLAIKELRLTAFFGGDWVSPRSQKIWYDNIALCHERIGPKA